MGIKKNQQETEEDQWFPQQVKAVKRDFNDLPKWMKDLAQREIRRDVVPKRSVEKPA